MTTIQKIKAFQNIPSADNIELANVLGWWVVVKKGEFKEGDLCVYVQIDMLVDPSLECFSFLAKDQNRDRVLITTRKIRGVFSQGLILPINVLNSLNLQEELKEGLDLTQQLKVTKYEKINLSLESSSKKQFPSQFISKTDEPNLKSIPSILEIMKNREIYFTTKMDGSSMTIIHKDNTTRVCSRNYEIEDGAMVDFVKKIGLHETLVNYGKNLAIQGEFCGPKINKNNLKLKEFKFYVFNIKRLDENTNNIDKYLSVDEMIKVCKELKLDMVPLLEIFICSEEWNVEKFQAYANNLYYSPKVYAEGIVVRPTVPLYDPTFGKISFKVINQNYKD